MFKEEQRVRVTNEGSAFHKWEGYIYYIPNGDPEHTYTFKYVVKLDNWHTPISFTEEELEKPE